MNNWFERLEWPDASKNCARNFVRLQFQYVFICIRLRKSERKNPKRSWLKDGGARKNFVERTPVTTILVFDNHCDQYQFIISRRKFNEHWNRLNFNTVINYRFRTVTEYFLHSICTRNSESTFLCQINWSV